MGKTWKQNVILGRQAASWLGPERYLEIRYEELVENTEATVRQICDFLDEPFEATMLENTTAGKRIAGPTGHHEVAAPVPAWRWQQAFQDAGRHGSPDARKAEERKKKAQRGEADRRQGSQAVSLTSC